MSDVSWTDGIAFWTTATDWTGGVVPGPSDNVTVAQGEPVITTDVGSITSLTINGEEFSSAVNLETGGALDVTGAVTETGFASLYMDIDEGSGGSHLTIGGVLTVSNLLDIGNAGLGSADSVTVGGLAGAGTIQITGGATAAHSAVLTVDAAAGFGQAGEITGEVELAQNAQIQFDGGQITEIGVAGVVTLNGAQAAISNNGTDSNSALSNLATVAGDFQMALGASVATGGASLTADALTIGNHLTLTGEMGADNIDIAPGGTLEIGSGGQVDDDNGVTFAGSASGEATLQLDAGSNFFQFINDFGQHDQLYLANLAYAPGATATLSGTTLTVNSGGAHETYTLLSPGATSFQASDDAGGVLVTAAPVCFATGTLVRTTRGEVAVEDLAVGEKVVTASGETRPVRWIGHRRIERPAPEAWPVRVRAGAFGADAPLRDLRLSPGHAVCVDVIGQVLVPVGELVNGTSVVAEEVAEITYWHVELESHDVLVAEGLPCESYLDAGNRAFFARAQGRLAAIEPARTLSESCLPFVADGPIVAAIRERLTARARALTGATPEAGVAGNPVLLARCA
jgi:hypothetical protein